MDALVIGRKSGHLVCGGSASAKIVVSGAAKSCAADLEFVDFRRPRNRFASLRPKCMVGGKPTPLADFVPWFAVQDDQQHSRIVGANKWRDPSRDGGNSDDQWVHS